LQNKLDERILTDAIQATFHHRKTIFRTNHPIFSDDFVNDQNRNLQWKRFLKKIKHNDDLSFETIMSLIKLKLQPIFENSI